MRSIISGVAVAASLVFASLNATEVLAQSKTLRFGTILTGDTPQMKAIAAFKEVAEAETDGELVIEIYPGGQLGGGGRAAIEAVQQGVADIYTSTDADFAGFYPPIQALSVPYLFTTSAQARAFFDGGFAGGIRDEIRKATGVTILSTEELGFRNFTSNKGVFRSPDDLKGLRIRVQESPIYIRMIEALGAAPTPIASTELLMSLRQGLVDGAENVINVIYDFGIADVQKYITLNGHVVGVLFLIINEDVYDDLTPEQRSAIDNATRAYNQVYREQTSSRADEYIRLIKEKGVEIHESTPEEKEKFKALMQKPALDYIAQSFGQNLVDELMKAASGN